MKTLTVGDFKSKFSEVIEWVKNGEEIAVTYGKSKKIIGYFSKNKNTKKEKPAKRTFGSLKHLGFELTDDFEMTPEEMGFEDGLFD